MARGWDSKSVEDQIQAFTVEAAVRSDDSLSAERLQVQRKRSSLLLSRASTAKQLETSTNERYSELLRRTLVALDTQLAEVK